MHVVVALGADVEDATQLSLVAWHPTMPSLDAGRTLVRRGSCTHRCSLRLFARGAVGGRLLHDHRAAYGGRPDLPACCARARRGAEVGGDVKPQRAPQGWRFGIETGTCASTEWRYSRSPKNPALKQLQKSSKFPGL